ncbi:hypothetical protein POTOM_001201 [Populus tomentosa]|uniref:Uncharacterized protein n=1 Tax=Populus tomentosa TaxID=118781 RepID=A0A8X8DHJ5_POPTO|nr:hypothetical protein POTOM_001201 [Populus tomentosa]
MLECDEEKPQVVEEDREVKRTRILELIRAQRAYNAIAEDGNRRVTFSPKRAISAGPCSNMYPPPKRKVQIDMPSPEHEGNSLQYGGDDTDLSPPRQRQRQYRSPSPAPDTNLNSDLSPPHKRRQRKLHHSPSPEPDTKSKHSSGLHPDLSPPRRHLSPPRRSKKDVEGSRSPDNSQSPRQCSTKSGNSRASMAQDISTPGKTGKNHLVQLLQRNSQKLVVRSMGFENRVRLDGGLSWEVNLDPGTVWSLDAYLSKLEWGKGLAQKREAELGWRS